MCPSVMSSVCSMSSSILLCIQGVQALELNAQYYSELDMKEELRVPTRVRVRVRRGKIMARVCHCH